MAVVLVQISETEYTVNDKKVFQNMDGHWVASQEMTTSEVAFFQKHLLKDNKLNSKI